MAWSQLPVLRSLSMRLSFWSFVLLFVVVTDKKMRNGSLSLSLSN